MQDSFAGKMFYSYASLKFFLLDLIGLTPFTDDKDKRDWNIEYAWTCQAGGSKVSFSLLSSDTLSQAIALSYVQITILKIFLA